MNYFQKNLKHLRAIHHLSQEQLARLFDLTKSNINSYENGAFPKIEMFLQIMDHFKLDPRKFVLLDMEKHSVLLKDSERQEDEEEKESHKLDKMLENGLVESQTFQYLEDISVDELKKLYRKQYRSKELLLKELMETKEKYLKLLEDRETHKGK